MKTLIQNINNIYGNKGQQWFDNLSKIIRTLSNYWQLKDVTPVDNMTYNYVAKAVTSSNQSVVIKISCDEKSIINEKQALKYFDGNGSIELLDYHEQYFAMLLHQVVPGKTLKSFYPAHVENVIDNYLSVVGRLHNNKFDGKYQFEHIADWLNSIDNCTSEQISPRLLHKAIALKNQLLSSATTQVLLHGDLHHDNILQDADQWLAIDPKGIIGEPEFEIAAFDFIHDSDLEKNLSIEKIFENRMQLIAQKSHYNLQRLNDWVFIRLILAAVWCIEDKGDPSWDIKLVEQMFPTYC